MAIWYVSPGSGTDNGSNGTAIGTPLRTVAYCDGTRSGVVAGDEVVILDGVHTLTGNDTGNLTKIRTIRSQGGRAVIGA
jgi:hypothetical protein